MGFPIRKSPGQRVLTSNRGLSQPATSFIASDCQGIHQMPFKTLEFISRAGINPPHNKAKSFVCKLFQHCVHSKIGTRMKEMNMSGPFEHPNIKFSVLSDIGVHITIKQRALWKAPHPTSGDTNDHLNIHGTSPRTSKWCHFISHCLSRQKLLGRFLSQWLIFKPIYDV